MLVEADEAISRYASAHVEHCGVPCKSDTGFAIGSIVRLRSRR
jgi:hypothetical protein